MIKIDRVSKRYSGNDTLAVDGLSLEVAPGEIYGFLGHNGAGKTTTIKMIVGLLEITQGSITVCGHDVVRESIASKSCIGYVPDNPDLYARLTGVEYLNFLADVYKVGPERTERINRYLDMFNLTDRVGDLIQSFSHGMKQKLALTGALFHQPKLLILDEPMVGLDPKSAFRFKELMREHCAQGNTVFFSTHILEVAENLCHRVGIISQGKLIAQGTMEELRHQRQAAGQSLEKIFLELTEEGGGTQ